MDPSVCVIYGEECSAVFTDGQGVATGVVVRCGCVCVKETIIDCSSITVSLIPNSINPGQITCKHLHTQNKNFNVLEINLVNTGLGDGGIRTPFKV